MKKKYNYILRPVFFILFFLFFSQHAAAENIPIEVLPSTHSGQNKLDTNKIIEIIKNEFDIVKGKTNFSKIFVSVIYDSRGHSDYLLTNLLSKEKLSYETVKIELDDGYKVADTIRNYMVTEDDFAQDPEMKIQASCPDDTVDIVFYLTDTSFSSSVTAIKDAKQKAAKAGYNYVEFYDQDATTTMFQNWMSCENLRLMAGFAHGSPNGIYLSDGSISPNYFESLRPGFLNNKVFYTVSSQVFNNPLKDAVLSASPQKFISGIDDLSTGCADNVFQCFMKNFLVNKQKMTSTLSICEEQHPDSGKHGIGGQGPEILLDPINSTDTAPSGKNEFPTK
ncbi:MAG: hypothetical protein GY874_07370 [Desulfobacteraceae bacterium]|nr:hypothetical protein [Desulfobacteraceae bacterium]